MLEFLGVDQAYQRKGLGHVLVDWGCRQADAMGLEVYLDATLAGLPFYTKHFNFENRKVLPIPNRPASFGTYELMAVVRPVKSTFAVDLDKKQAVRSIEVEIGDIDV